MIKLSITDGQGRPFDRQRFMRQFETAMQNAVEKAKENIGDKARQTICPVHHQKPTVIRTAQGFEVKGCCKELIDAVKARLHR